MIPADAYERGITLMFHMLAMRRGDHWRLLDTDTPVGHVNEAQMIAEAVADVMRYVPLPDRELGVVGAVANLGVALYATCAPRLAVDHELAVQREQLAQARPAGRSVPAGPVRGPAPASHVGDRPPERGPVERDAGAVLDELTREHELPLPGAAEQDPRVGNVTLGVPPDGDPEPALFAAVRPGETPAHVDELVAAGVGDGRPLLDVLAPPPEVDGRPVAPEL